MSVLLTGLLVLHGTASVLLAVFGWHRLRLAWAARRPARVRTRPTSFGRTPYVTVQIPLYNERYVAERAIRAAARIAYPPHALEIQVLDDSTDDTTAIVRNTIAALRGSGVRIVHIRRARRAGYKAGALAHGLQTARGEFIAIFDADFVPPPDFVRSILPEFGDPVVGMVQARWGHLNRDMSWLTRAQALQLDAHFRIEHAVREARGVFFNFNGTAGMWRRAAIDGAGGWQTDTLTEDLDLSYRAQLAGWRFVYRDDVEVPSEVPAEMAAYRTQQQRWAQGGVETARKLLGRLVRAPLPSRIKRAALAHLLIHGTYPLLVVVTLVGLAVAAIHGPTSAQWIMTVDGSLLLFAMVSLGVFYGTALWHRGEPRPWAALPLVPVIMVLGAGIALGQTVAVARGLTGIRVPFRRTPKYRLQASTVPGCRGASRYRLSAPGQAARDILLGLALLTAALALIVRHQLPPSGLVVLLSIGLLWVGGSAWFQQTRDAAT